MFFSRPRPASRVERLVLVILLGVIAACAALFYLEWSSTEAAAVERNRLQRALEANEGVLSYLKDIETGQRGYLLTGDRAYLEPYEQAKVALPAAIDRLSDETRNSRTYLRSLIEDKLAEVDSTLAVRDQQGPQAALALVQTDQGRETMEAIRRRTDEIRDGVTASLQEETRASGLRTRGLRLAFLGILGVLASLVIISLKALERATSRREALLNQWAEERNRLRVLLTSIGDGVIVVDEDLKVEFLNPVGADITGWEPEEAVGRHLDAVFSIKDERDGSPMETPVYKVLRDRKATLMANHAVLTRRDGTTIPVDDSAAPIFDNDQKLAGVVMVFRDVTGRRSVSRALRQWEHIFVHAGFGMAVISPGPEPTLEQVNPAFAIMHGYTVEELKGRKYESVVAQQAWPAKLEFLSGGEDHLITEGMHVRKDGALFPVLSHITLVRRPEGSIAYAIGYWSDNSDRKRVESDLQMSEARYRLTADSLPQLIWTATADGTTEYLNNRWTEQTGITLEEAAKGGWLYSISPEDLSTCERDWQEALRTGNPFQADCRMKVKEGYRWHTCRAVPVREASGKIVRWFGSCTDIHEQRIWSDALQQSKHALETLNAALQMSNTDLEQFAYAASHDLQEPLRMVKIYSQLLQTEIDGHLDSRSRSYLNFITDGADRMEALLKDLLSYSRASAELTDAPPADSQEVLKQALANLSTLIADTEARITSEDLPMVQMPEIHLLQVFQNLISNAIKYRKSGVRPEVQIAAEHTEEMVIVSITDNGIGIPQQHMEQIFRLFRRLHGTDVPGTGIGLALCKKLVERNGGRMWVTSSPGKGSTFCFSALRIGGRDQA